MKDPKKMTTKELIDLADEIKRGMTKELLKDMDEIERVRSKSHLASES